VVIGAVVRSQTGTGNSFVESGDTECSDCHVLMTDLSVRNSAALSKTTGCNSSRFFCVFVPVPSDCILLMFFSGGSSKQDFVRPTSFAFASLLSLD
jgi:hypothetical protein